MVKFMVNYSHMEAKSIKTPPNLFDRLKQFVAEWRAAGYPCEDYPLIGEILLYQKEGEESVALLRYLREPQFYALEVYWYVRLVLKTPKIIDIYKHCYGADKQSFFNALGIPLSSDAMDYVSIDDIIERAAKDEVFVAEKKIQTLHESLNLEYPSYIFALAMGAGKTVLIGTIIATEFAMALRHPGEKFMSNALVFAPGTTIIESLRELSDMPYENILPPALLREFLANLKIKFPSAGKTIGIHPGSAYNLIVTNTEKISLRAKSRNGQSAEMYEQKKIEANLRLQDIASLPNLGIFSDEAHHTYGNVFNNIKRVRETIDYIHERTPLVAVVNTTGTPYHDKKMLKDVIVWYGLGDGIRDNILKEVTNNLSVYDMRQSDAEEEVIQDIINAFFDDYGKIRLPDGSMAKIAFYFKSQEHLDNSHVHIQKAMAKRGESASQILVNTEKSEKHEMDEFKRINNPSCQKRVILLVQKGVEGWNCPSLFSCALIKPQTGPTHVLQASTRCLRQVPGNKHRARIFLDYGNHEILNNQLISNFGTNLLQLEGGRREREIVTLRVRETALPKLEITRIISRAVRVDAPQPEIVLKKPKTAKPSPAAWRSTYTESFDDPAKMLKAIGDITEIESITHNVDCHTAAYRIASRYHLPIMPLLSRIEALYPEKEVPAEALTDLYNQVDSQQVGYKNVEEKVTEAMALIKVKDESGNDVFAKDDDGSFVHHLRLTQSNYKRMEDLGLFTHQSPEKDPHDISFHYTPYNFDSQPENGFFRQIMEMLGTDLGNVQSLLFTGGLTDPQKTDFHFEYMGEDNRYHRYYPDFVLIKKTGEFYIVEVKGEKERGEKTVEAKRKAVEKLQKVNQNKFKYQVVYTPGNDVSAREIKAIVDWIRK